MKTPARLVAGKLLCAASLCVILHFFFTAGPARAGTEKVIVFAAASTTNVITDIIAAFGAGNRIRVTPSFASSSTLAKQIENGAPAELFISADQKWMDYLASRNLIRADSRINLMGNRIVLIAPAESHLAAAEIHADTPLGRWVGEGRLAMGDPSHTPVGTYARMALVNLGLWDAVSDKIAPAKDVRAALMLIERAETPLGLVYATDAAVSAKVRVIGRFPESSHPPIVYPAALTANRDTPAARQFFSFLQSAPAQSIFTKHGFTTR